MTVQFRKRNMTMLIVYLQSVFSSENKLDKAGPLEIGKRRKMKWKKQSRASLKIREDWLRAEESDGTDFQAFSCIDQEYKILIISLLPNLKAICTRITILKFCLSLI